MNVRVFCNLKGHTFCIFWASVAKNVKIDTERCQKCSLLVTPPFPLDLPLPFFLQGQECEVGHSQWMTSCPAWIWGEEASLWSRWMWRTVWLLDSLWKAKTFAFGRYIACSSRRGGLQAVVMYENGILFWVQSCPMCNGIQYGDNWQYNHWILHQWPGQYNWSLAKD